MSSGGEMESWPQRHASRPGVTWRAARLSATAARRRPPTSTLASTCPGGISRADWGTLVHVCWPVGAQTRHIRLSQLLQASHRRLEVVAWASGGWDFGYPKGRLGLRGHVVATGVHCGVLNMVKSPRCRFVPQNAPAGRGWGLKIVGRPPTP